MSLGATMKATRIYTGSDGVTHFEDIEIPLSDRGDIGNLSELEPATGIIFRETPGSYDYDWLAEHAKLIVDTRNAVKVKKKYAGKIFSA